MSLHGTIRDLGYTPRAQRIPGALPCVAAECDTPREAARLAVAVGLSYGVPVVEGVTVRWPDRAWDRDIEA